MNNVIKISDFEVPIVEYQGQRMITFKMIDQVHQRPEGTAKDRFVKNRNRLIEGKHYHEIGRDKIHTDLWMSFGFSKFAAKGILLTERGYLMLVKSFTDDLAWEVQDKLVEGYFRGREKVSKIDMIIQQAMELKRIEEEQQEHNQRLLTLEAKADFNSGNTGFWTIRAFCNMNNIRLNLREASNRGRQATELSKEHGILTGKAYDEMFGKVNSYHEDVLVEVFQDLMPRDIAV